MSHVVPSMPQQAPTAAETIGFLQQGGAFALLCVVIIGGGFVAWFGGRALFKLLREFLVATTNLLTELRDETKALRISTQQTAEQVGPWDTPEWLHKRLDVLEKRADEIKQAIADLRVAMAKGAQ